MEHMHAAGPPDTQCVPFLIPGERDAPAVAVVAADPDARHATALYLRLARGCSVLGVGSVVQALLRWETFAPSLLILLAERKGFWAPSELVAWRRACGVPAVVLVTDLQDGDHEELRAAGATGVVRVPVPADGLIEAIEEVLAQASQR